MRYLPSMSISDKFEGLLKAYRWAVSTAGMCVYVRGGADVPPLTFYEDINYEKTIFF